MNTSLQDLAQQEPWRRNFGAPHNALDPTWSPSAYDALCPVDIESDGTNWWVCKRCGFVGAGPTTLHRPPRHPLPFFVHAALFFLKKREERKLKAPSPRTVVHQMLYIAGVALRYAAVQPPSKLGPFLDRMATP